MIASRPSIYGTLLALDERELDTVHGGFTAHVFENLLDRRPSVALTRGDVRAPGALLSRVHSSCVTSEAFGGCDCDCAEQLSRALAGIARAGRGVLFYLMQEGRGAGFAAKARDRMLVQGSGHRLTTFEAYERMGLGRDLRRYEEVGFARRMLGITAPLRLLTNNRDKVEALAAANVPVEGTEPLAGTTTPFNLHYVDSKRRSGHALRSAAGEIRAAELPESVEDFDPDAPGGGRGAIRIASYLLPVTLDGGIAWLRVHVSFEVGARAERILLSHGDLAGRAPLVALHREDLLERFPLRTPGPAARRWRAIVRAMAERGSGLALFRAAESPAGADDDVEAAAALVLRHLPVPRVRILVGSDGSDALGDALRGLGVEIEARVTIGEG